MQAFRTLGNIKADTLIEKVNNIVKNGWKDYCFGQASLDKIQSLDVIILFSLPEKHNLMLRKLVVNKELLNIFKDEITEISNIFEQHYPNKQPKRITLNNMRSNSIIPEHRDFLYHYENTIRVHVPIITNENVVFQFPSVNQSLHMKVGEIVEFNNNIPHSGYNKSDDDRIHLILDFGEKNDPYYGEVDYDWNNYL